jgi:lysophospholipase L1-like esterase
MQVINAAVIGFLSGQELSYLMTEIIDLQPDLIVTLGGHNDFRTIGLNAPEHRWVDFNGISQQHYDFKSLHQLKYAPIGTRAGAALISVYAHTSQLIRRFKAGVRRVAGRREVNTSRAPMKRDTVISNYVRNIYKMHRFCRAFDARFLCALQPSRKSIFDDDSKGHEYSDFRNEVKKELQLLGVAYIDLNEHKDQYTVDMFMDSVHLDERGNRVMANLLAPMVQAQLPEPAQSV